MFFQLLVPRFSSGLSMDFLKRTTTTFVSPDALKIIGPHIETWLAQKASRHTVFQSPLD